MEQLPRGSNGPEGKEDLGVLLGFQHRTAKVSQCWAGSGGMLGTLAQGMQQTALLHSRGKNKNVYRTKQGNLTPQSHWGCPHIAAKKEFPHKHISFLTTGISLLCID